MQIHRMRSLCLLLAIASTVLAAELPKPIVTGLKTPESVCLGPNGSIYVTEIGEFGKDGDGQVSVIKNGKAAVFASGLDDPKGIVATQDALYVTDKTRVVKIDFQGKVTPFAGADSFPSPPMFLNDVAFEPKSGALFVSDSGDLMGSGGAVYRIDLKSRKVDLVVSAKNLPELKTPNGLALDGESHLLLLDFGSGALYRIKLADNSAQKIAEGFDGGDGLTWDKFGRLFVTSWKTGKVFGFPRPGKKSAELPYQFQQAADSCIDATSQNLLVPDMKAGTLTAIPTTIAGWEVDESPLPIRTEVAFANVTWTGWSPMNESGLSVPLRPISLMSLGDGSKRVAVATQQGVIHVLPERGSGATRVMLDISNKVRYSDKQNEEGLLGLAFHPKFKENGELFVFYTDVKAKMANVVSRFKVSKTNQADPASEEEIIRFEKPYWNHDGGTILFGPDGFLYITHGDGGAGNDPHESGQNLKTLLGKVIRIDVDRKAGGKNYAIPKDNPFVSHSGAAPEVWAYGLRNLWRMAFDRKTGQLWAGEVGQNLYEEIVILKAGGNYGWNLRESLHPFGAKGVDVRNDLIEPIWEYHHDVGKSITGGLVYRGKKLPELDGAYLYADYVTGRVWALWYDEAKGRVVANREIKAPGRPVISFGEDADGEPYLLTVTDTGRGIFGLAKSDKP